MSAPAMQAIVSSPHFEEILIRADRFAVMSTLARGMGHDLRGPLQTLTLIGDPHADFFAGPESGRLRGTVSSAVQHLTDTISRFSQVYAPIDTEPAPLILNELLDCVMELQSYQRGLPQAEVTLEVPAGMPPIRGVESYLRHLLLNLVVNAKQALAGRTEGLIVLAAEQRGPSILLSVEDNGPGLPPDERTRVFEAFQTSREGSLGIGLTVVRWLTERQGGQVSLEAGKLGGVRAEVVLPSWRRG